MAMALTATLLLVFLVAPEFGTTNVFVYIAICSIVGSLSVVSCKARSPQALDPNPLGPKLCRHDSHCSGALCSQLLGQRTHNSKPPQV